MRDEHRTQVGSCVCSFCYSRGRYMEEAIRDDDRALDGLARFPEAHSITSLSRSQIFKLERDGKFPKRVQLSGGAVAWRRSELKAWLDSLPRRELGKREAA